MQRTVYVCDRCGIEFKDEPGTVTGFNCEAGGNGLAKYNVASYLDFCKACRALVVQKLADAFKKEPHK